MKDLIDIILKGLAGYVPELVAVVSHPKQAILVRIEAGPERLQRALVFCGLSIAIAFVLQAPLLSAGEDFNTIAGSMLALRIIAILTFAAFVVGFFRLVGGKGDYETTLCACLYIVSPVYLFFIVTGVIELGLLNSYDPEIARLWRSGQGLHETWAREFVDSAPALAFGFLSIWLLQLTVSIIWFLVCWGVYRAIHQVSKPRSILVYLVTTALWYVYWIGTLVVMRGLHGGTLSPLA